MKDSKRMYNSSMEEYSVKAGLRNKPTPTISTSCVRLTVFVAWIVMLVFKVEAVALD